MQISMATSYTRFTVVTFFSLLVVGFLFVFNKTYYLKDFENTSFNFHPPAIVPPSTSLLETGTYRSSNSSTLEFWNKSLNQFKDRLPIKHYNLTIVTAFIDIGVFGKGTPSNLRDHNIYEKWATAYAMIHSPLVFYTDSRDFQKHMQRVRHNLLHLTHFVFVNRSALWSFQQRDKIDAIYKAGYPKHWPDTVYPDYTCVTHSKFDFLADAIVNSYFPSDHTVWMDVGYLRDLLPQVTHNKSQPAYVMLPPQDFNSSRVMVGQVSRPDFKTDWKTIFRVNIHWVAGGFFLARSTLMLEFVQQYRKAVTLFLEKGESQADQAVIFSMYTDSGREIVHPSVELQAIPTDWFTLGIRCLVLINSTHSVQ